MNKENDYFLELMSNPTFSPQDFLLVGLNSENTGILDKSVYKKAQIVQDNPLFQTEGKFDESKFDRAYEQALYQYNDLARLTLATKPFFRDDIFAPDELKDSKDNPEFTITKTQNPLRQLESFVSFGVKEAPTQSVREIAEANPTFDYKTGTWTDSPNDTWFDNFINPKVLAQWDFDADENGKPTNNPDEVVYHKGEKKIDPTTGTYYYETLGDRNIYGREVLSGFDTLTVDGSAANKLDFLDSDDRDKSITGSMARAVAQIAPVFIPYVGEAYIASRIAISLGEIIPTIGKAFTGSDNEFLSKIEGINKAMTFSTSDYTQGSAEEGIEANPWTMETGLKLIADVFTQLAEQRWVFKYGTALFSGVNPKIVGETEAAQAAKQALLEKNAAKMGFNLDKIREGKSAEEILTSIESLKAANFASAQIALNKLLETGLKLSKHLSMAYMTGITTASSYGEAKAQGASDTEAALFALGYTAGEYALLSTDLGQWILPELKLEKFQSQQLARDLTRITREAGDSNALTTEGKKKWYRSLFNFGLKVFKNHYDDSMASSFTKMTTSAMLGEGIEETSEELLLDVSKTLFNAGNELLLGESAFQFDDAWSDITTRYGMSFIGGTIGGGIATALPGYRATMEAYRRAKDPKSQSDAYKRLVHLVANGQAEEFLNTANKTDLGNRYLSTQMVNNSDGTVSYKPAENYEDSQDYAIKLELTKLVNMIKDILNSEGAAISQDSLLNDKLIRRELKYHSLLGSNVLGVYTNEFNNLLSDLVDTSNQINTLETAKSGSNPDRTDAQNREDKKEFSKADEEKLSNLIEKLKKLRDRLKAYKDGTVANEFIGEALFELDTQVSSAYAPTDFRRWAEDESGKNYTELSDAERTNLKKRWKDASLNRRDITHRAYLVFKKNLEALANVLSLHEEEYFQNKNNILKDLESLFLDTKESIALNTGETTIEDATNLDTSYVPTKLWEGLLNSMKNDLDENAYNSFKDAFDQIGVTYEESLGIEKLPNTIEELNNLTPEAKQRLEDDLDPYDTFNPATDLDLIDAIKNRKREYYALKDLDTLSAFDIFVSNTAVLNKLIDTLKEAKYLTPSTKLYLYNFINRADITLDSKDKFNSALEQISNSPVEELLSNMVETLRSTGIDTTGMITDLAKFMSDLAYSRTLDNFGYSPEVDLKIRKTIDLIDIAHSHIEAAKTEIKADLGNLYGYNATINEVNSNNKLSTLKASTANSLMYELAKIRKDLQFYQAIFNTNTNNKLTDHIKTDLKLNSIYYNALKNWSVEIPDGTEGKNELNDALTNATTLLSIIDNNKTSLTLDERKEMNKERLAIELSLHNVLKNIADIKSLLSKFNFVATTEENLLNSGITSQTDRNFVWHLASIAANNPMAVANEFKEAISTKYAPIIAQEEAIKRAYSYILNPKVFELFAEAYNEIYKELLAAERAKNGDTSTTLDTDEYLLSTRHFLIEGSPGSGKSSSVYSTLYNMLKANHPELLNKIWFVSNSKANAETASLDMENVTAMSKEEYFRRIGINYNQTYDANGLVNVDENNLVRDENGIYHFKDVNINEGIEAPSLIFFDEVSSFSQLDLLLSEEFLKAKDIYSFAAGDFNQIGAQGNFQNSEGDNVYVRLANTNFIGSWKLGSSMRSNNVYKSKNLSVMRESLKDIEAKLLKYADLESMSSPIKFSYYETDEGLFGDKVTEFNSNAEDSIRKMLDTLKDGEQLNYIYDDTTTALYQALKLLNDGGLYLGKINFVSAAASQGQEGLYYIVDLNKTFQDSVDALALGKNESAINFGKTIYTAMSRAKLGTLIIGNYDYDSDNPLFLSYKQTTLLKQNLSDLIIQNFGNERRQILDYALDGTNEHTKINRNIPEPPATQPNTLPTTQPPTSGDEGTSEEEVLRNNMDKPSNVENKEEGKLNILLHSFLCQETGCDIVENGKREPTDDDATLRLGRYYDKRIDNLNGLAQIDKRGNIKLSGVKVSDDGTIIEGKEKLLNMLNRIRNAACYSSDMSELVDEVASILGTEKDNIRINFIYKSQFRDYNDESKTIEWYDKHPEELKFYKGKSEYLAGIFNEDNVSDDIRSPKDLTIGILITTADGTQLMEVPLAKMTSPLTLLNTSEFEAIRQIFEDCGLDVSKFKKKIKQELLNKSTIPHLKEYAKLLELYTGSAYNTISFLNDDFMLGKGTVSGITTVSSEKGKDYFHNMDYYYNGKWIPFDEYKKRMPWRKMSRIFTSVENKTVSVGNMDIHGGKPFVLVSDILTGLSDEAMLKSYIQQCKNNTKPLIRLVYVTPPSATMSEYILNLDTALTKNRNNAENIDKDLGTKITAFRLLLFALDEGSNFRAAFKNWNDSSPLADKVKYENRMKALHNLIKNLTDYELKNGTKKLFELLNTPLRSVDRTFLTALSYKDGEGKDCYILATNVNLTLRHVFQMELHHLLLSKSWYGDSMQTNLITKNGDNITIDDVAKERVLAFIEDAENNNWTGVQFHLKLKPQSTSTILDISFAEIDTELGKDYFVSGKPIMINGKLDATSIEMEVVPLLDWVIRGGLGRDVDTLNTDLTSTNIFEETKKWKGIKAKNHKDYINGKETKPIKDPKIEEFNNLMKDSNFSRQESKILKDEFESLEDSEKTRILKDPREFIITRTGRPCIIKDGKVKISKNLKNVDSAIILNGDILFTLKNDSQNVYKLEEDSTGNISAVQVDEETLIKFKPNIKKKKTLDKLDEFILRVHKEPVVTQNPGSTTEQSPSPSTEISVDFETNFNNAREAVGTVLNIDSSKMMSIDKMDRAIELLTNPLNISKGGGIYADVYTKEVYQINNEDKYRYVIVEDGKAYAALYTLIGPRAYKKLSQDNPALLLAAIQILEKNHKDYIDDIVAKMNENNNDNCSITKPF